MKQQILSDSDSEEIKEFKINENYAKRFEHNKKRDELFQLQEKYKYEEEEESSSEDEVEDDDGELITPQIDSQIMKTIKMIQEKNPVIYDKSQKLINDQLVEEARQKFEQKSVEKGITLKEYQTDMLLNPQKPVKTFAQEQEDVKQELKNAFKNIEEEEDELFTVRKQQAEEDYSKFILNEMYKDEPQKQDWDQFKKELDPDQQFLMDYVLHKGWKDKEVARPALEALHDTTDEEDEERMEEFEYKHNFRFEEEVSQYVVTHARNIPGTIRRKDDKRTIQRQSAAERKAELKKQKAEELKRLKNLKKQELQEKLKQIQQMAGGDLIGLDEIDLEKEFDPDEYDQKMSNTFSEDYYTNLERKSSGKPKKPKWDDDIDISDIVPPKKPKVPEGEIMMDADYLEPTEQVDKSLIEKYMDEYYQLDFEDIVADQPVRFKYRTVDPDFYSLKPEEILEAEDADLNEVIGLKKLAPYRQGPTKEKDQQKWKASKKKKLWEFRSKLKGKEVKQEEEEEVVETKKRKKDLQIDAQRLESYSASSSKKKKNKK